jgi:hypothetical protein
MGCVSMGYTFDERKSFFPHIKVAREMTAQTDMLAL